MADKTLMTKAGISLVISAGLIACAMIGPKYTLTVNESAEGGASGPAIEYKHVDAPAADRDNNLVSSEAWQEIYPEICASYEANGNNNYRVSYLAEDQDPYLVDIYEGFGFAKDYTSAIAHNYCLEDVANTERPHPLANCLTCKTADFTALVNNMGSEAYSLAFEDVVSNMHENVGCYNCHENQAGDGGKLVLTHDYTIASIGDEVEAGTIKASTAVCGQCHIEYYFNAENNKATTAPYENVDQMDPDAIYAYYQELDFADWVQESTGTRMLKAQHPETETFLGKGSLHAGMGLTCADCHMEKTVSDSGVAYSSHSLVSPLESQAILDTCASCHGSTDMKEKVHAIQKQVTDREKELGNKLADLKNKLAEANASGEYTEDELNAIRELHRAAQWYFDFDYVENSEGAHNSALANRCLDTANDYMDQALALFK